MANKPTPTTERLRLRDRDVELKVEERPVDELRLDPNNPRLQHEVAPLLEEGKTPKEQEIEDLLWEKDEVKKLYQSVKTTRGLQEPLYVRPNGIVAEGNERLTVLRKIKEQLETNPEQYFDKEAIPDLQETVEHVPCRVLPDDVGEDEVSVLLAQQHVGGKHQWTAFDQAAHVYRMSEDLGIPTSEIATHLRKSKTWVRQKKRAYKWTKQYLDRFDWDTSKVSIRDYSFFEELYKKRAALRRAGLDVDTDEGMRKFQDMVANGEITAALDVRNLPKLLDEPETEKLVQQGRVKEAQERLREIDPAEFSKRFESLTRTKKQLRKLTREDMQKLRENERFRDLLAEVAEEIEDVLDQVQD